MSRNIRSHRCNHLCHYHLLDQLVLLGSHQLGLLLQLDLFHLCVQLGQLCSHQLGQLLQLVQSLQLGLSHQWDQLVQCRLVRQCLWLNRVHQLVQWDQSRPLGLSHQLVQLGQILLGRLGLCHQWDLCFLNFLWVQCHLWGQLRQHQLDQLFRSVLWVLFRLCYLHLLDLFHQWDQLGQSLQ